MDLGGFFSAEGPFMNVLNKTGELIIVSVLWLLCCLPVVTIGASTTALYYAVVKTVRKDRGYVYKEFFRSFKRNLKSGTLLTVIFLLLAVVLLYNREYLNAVTGGNELALAQGVLGQADGMTLLLYVVYDGILIIMALILVYLFPALSRFDMKTADIVKLAFVMSIRHIYITLALGGAFALVVFLQYRILPLYTLIILPGLFTFLASFLTEKAMKKYMGEAPEGEDAWYMEL